MSPRRRHVLRVLAAAPAEGLALWMAARADLLPAPFVHAWLVALGLRLLLGSEDRGVLTPRLVRPAATVLLALLLALLSQRLAAGGPLALRGILEGACAVQTLLHLAARGPGAGFVGLLLSALHVAGAGILARGPADALLGTGYVAALALALLAGERLGGRASAPTPARAWVAPLLGVLLLGFPLGLGAYLLVPRLAPRGRPDALARPAALPGGAADADEVEAGAEPTVLRTGPGGPVTGVAFGAVAEVQRDLTPWFEVREPDRAGGPPPLYLRDNVHDHFHLNGALNDTVSHGRAPRGYLDAHDGRADGWVPLAPVPAGAAVRRLEITVLRGGHRRLYLLPEVLRLCVRRAGRVLEGLQVERTGNETLEVDRAFEAGDVVVAECLPLPTQDARLEGRRSDTAVCPLGPTYLQVPARSRAVLRRLAEQVVGAETDPWRRARRLEAWLKAPPFVYTLALPDLDERDRVVDFLTRVQRGHCACYAQALCLLLRALGHPTRYARGFWGGDLQEQHALLLLRGSHYHAWTEMFLDGVGWVPLNPTPPDRRAIDADTLTGEGGRARPGAEETFSLLDHDAGQWQRLMARAGDLLGGGARGAQEFAYGPRGGYVGWWGPVLLGLLVAGVRGRRATRRLVAPAGGPAPRGPYGRALRLLARRGLVRARSQTLGEFAAQVGARLPGAAEPFARLTASAAAERYGPGAAAAAADREALVRLEAALAGPPAARPS